MPTIITHAVVAAAAGGMTAERKTPPRFWVLLILSSILPDADVIGFRLGIAYEDFLGHRGFFHSPFFALLLSAAVTLAFLRQKKFFLVLFLVTASHGVLDAFTNGGLGIALLSPFSNERFFFPWRPLEVAPIGIRSFFSAWGVKIMISEVLWVWLPLLAAWVIVRRSASPPPDQLADR
jgi:inner membrane protein